MGCQGRWEISCPSTAIAWITNVDQQDITNNPDGKSALPPLRGTRRLPRCCSGAAHSLRGVGGVDVHRSAEVGHAPPEGGNVALAVGAGLTSREAMSPCSTISSEKQFPKANGISAAASMMSLVRANSLLSMESSETTEDDLDGENYNYRRSRLRRTKLVNRIIVEPQSAPRVCWDVTSCLMVAYECIVIPLQFFEVQDLNFAVVASWILRIFWTIDIPFSCITGYYRLGGQMEMRPRYVFLQYLKSWFFFDLTMVIIDWMDILTTALNKDIGDLGKTVKALASTPLPAQCASLT